MTGPLAQRISWGMLHRLVSATISWFIGLFGSGGAPVVPSEAPAGVSAGDVVSRPMPELDQRWAWRIPAHAAWTPAAPIAPLAADHVVVLWRVEVRHAEDVHSAPEPIETPAGFDALTPQVKAPTGLFVRR